VGEKRGILEENTHNLPCNCEKHLQID